jgi:hypothetical protein
MLLALHTAACGLLLATVCAAVVALLVGAARSGWHDRATRAADHAARRQRTLLWASLMIGGFAAAGWLRSVAVAPHHAMYVDEPWYIEAAGNLVERGALLLCEGSGQTQICNPYPKASGWPVMLAATFWCAGRGSAAAFALSLLLSAAAVPLAGCVTRLAGGQLHHVLLSMLLLGVHPLHVVWSATAETNSPATAVLLAGLAAVLSLMKRDSLPAALLSGGALGLAVAMRPELIMAALPALLALAAVRRVRRQHLCIAGAGIALGASSLLASWALYLANSAGAFLSWRNLQPNFARVLAQEPGAPLSGWILLAAAVGSVVVFRRGDKLQSATLSVAGALTLLAALVYDQRIFYGRTVLGGLSVFIPLAALALPRVAGSPARRLYAGMLAIAALGFSCWLAVPELRHMELPETQILETRLPQALRDIAIEPDAVVLAEWPTVLAADTPIAALSARAYASADEDALASLSNALARQPHYLVCDMFCEPSFAGSGLSGCERLFDQFLVEEVSGVSQGRRRYGLYKLVARRADGTQQSSPCPFGRR